MTKTQILLWKTIEGTRRLRVRVSFILFYSELSPIDPWCNMLRTLVGRKKHEDALSDEFLSKYGLLYRSISESTLPCTYFTLSYCSKVDSAGSQYYVTGTDEYTRHLPNNLSDYTESREKNINNDRQFKSIRVAN